MQPEVSFVFGLIFGTFFGGFLILLLQIMDEQCDKSGCISCDASGCQTGFGCACSDK